MATFQFKNSNYNVTPPQAGAASITNTSADAANFQQVITDLPVTSSTGVSVSGETLAILAIRIAGRVVPTGYETLQDFVLQQVEGFSLLDVTEQGSITSRTALELLRLNAGAFSADTATSLPRYKKLLNELEGAHDQFKDIVISGRRLFLGAPFEADVKEGFFDSSKHYIVVDEDDAADRLKLVKYNNKNNVNASYWFDAGTGSETTGLNTLNTRASKTSNSSQVNASKQFSFDGSSSSVVSTSNDTITISNHGFITGDTVFYEPEILHTIDSSNSTEVVLASNTFNISSHGYTNGDIIKYSFTASTDLGITGLTENQFYMVDNIDSNNFRLLDIAQSFTDDTCDFTQFDATVTHTANSSIVAGLAIFGPDFNQVPAGDSTVASITDSTTFELNHAGVALSANNVAGITFAPIIAITALGVGDHTFSCAYPRGIGAAAATIGRQEFFVIEVDTNNFKLATTADNADAGTAIDITAVGKGTEHTLEGNFTKELDVGQFVGVFEEFTFNGSSDVSSNQITIEGGAFAVSCNTGSDKDVTFSANTNILAGMNVRGSGIPAGTKVASVAANNQSCVLTKDATSSLTGTSLTFFTDHGFSTGDTADYSAGAGTKITNLNEGQRYFIIRVDESTVKLASTSADATAGTAITLSGGSGVSHTLSLNYGTKIYRIEDRNKFFTSSSDAQVFTNRDLKVPNWTLDPAKDAIVAKVFAYETTALVNGVTSSSTSVNIDTITGEKILPGAVVTETTGGTNATNDDISGGGVKVVTSTQSIETTEGSITEENSSTAAITLNSAQTFIDNGSLTFKSYAIEPYVNLDSGDRVEDDTVPKLSADLDTNGKNIVNDALSLKTSTGSKKLIVGNTNAVELYYNDTKTIETVDGGVSVAGTIAGSGNVTIDTDTLVVDVANDRVGVNKASPSVALDVTGAITASGNITAFSDERLKDDIQTLDGTKVLEMRGVEFTKDGEIGSGVIAQELEKVAPELVSNSGEYKSVAYGNLVGYLIEAVKDLQKQVDEFKK
jgi:hypothetical protein